MWQRANNLLWQKPEGHGFSHAANARPKAYTALPKAEVKA
jgi:hypothetical protein